jgi:cobyrinic acid a,c-diamide synthase
MIDHVGRHVDLAAISAIAASRVTGQPWDPAPGGPVTSSVTVALAAGKAFSFGYAEHRELLLGTGAEVVEFDPLTDPLPPRSAALVLPGGFPEQFGAELSDNELVRQQIKSLAASGAPLQAECAGLAYLVDDLDGHPMCGVLSGSAHFTDRLTLGYRNAVAVTESPLYEIGDRTVGHEFHRTTVKFTQDYAPAWVFGNQTADRTRDGAVHIGVHASYLHTHPAALPQAISRFVAAAESSFYSSHRNL